MPARRLEVEGRAWRVYPSGFLTPSVGDEFALIFVTGRGTEREVRLARYAPVRSRSREEALAEMDDEALRRLFRQAQGSVRAPEAGYRA